jgi:hypothetical protein
MKKSSIRMTFALALLCAALSTAMFASDENAYLYFVQGIPGHDFSTSVDPQFPVDVLLNDEICYGHGLQYGSITGPLSLPPGTYDVKLSMANSMAPCTNTPLIDKTLTLAGGRNISAVATLGGDGTPTLATFANNFSSVAVNTGRLLFAEAADSPAVQLILENSSTKKLYTYVVNPGKLLDVSLPAGDYTLEVNQGTTTLVPSTGVTLFSQSATLLYAIGEAGNDTVTLAIKTVRSVI